ADRKPAHELGGRRVAAGVAAAEKEAARNHLLKGDCVMTIGSQQPSKSRVRSPSALRCSLAVVLAMSPSLSQAVEAPPRQRYGKSVVLTWDTSVSFQYPGPGEPIRKAVLQNAMSIYVSSMGRVFRKTGNIVRTPTGE